MTRPEPFLEAACRIGSRLCRDAIWAGDACNWAGWLTERVRGVTTPVYGLERSSGSPWNSISLYSGTSGIALFLARLWSESRDPLHKTTLHGVVNQILQRLNELDSAPGPGFYVGRAGVAYTLLEAGGLLDHDGLVERGLQELEAAGAAKPARDTVDLTAGSAGLIPVLLRAGETFGVDRLQQHARAHGEALLSYADRDADDWSWRAAPEQRALTGFSHGTAGVIAALAALHRETNDARYLEAIVGGVRFEDRHFDPERGNWPDLRSLKSDQSAPRFMLGWCHGAPGIALGRLTLLHLREREPAILAPLSAALSTTRDSLQFVDVSGAPGFCLCHGLGGNADILLLAAGLLGASEWRVAAEAVGTAGLQAIEHRNRPWPGENVGAGESPGLMLGSAGIGHFYLRLASASIPSILLPGSAWSDPVHGSGVDGGPSVE